MQALPSQFTVFDEAAVHQAPYSRDNVRVLLVLSLGKNREIIVPNPSAVAKHLYNTE